jgi:hypothetical protein
MNPTLASEPSLRCKLLVFFGFIVSLSATLWFGSSLNNSVGILPHIGFLCAGLCIVGSLMFFWSAICAYFVRTWGWSVWSCYGAGLPFLLAGLLLLFFASTDRLQQFGSFLGGDLILVGYICRRLAFPHLTDEQAAAPTPPLSLFSK